MKKVLVVEDYEDAREFMKLSLEMMGYVVLEAGDGLEAIEMVKQFNPDLILMDVSLPMVDGLTTTRFIRGFDESKETPVIAVTSFGREYLRKAKEAGCNTLIKKPVDFDELKPILNKYLSTEN